VRSPNRLLYAIAPLLIAIASIALSATCVSYASEDATRVAFLTDVASPDDLGTHDAAAWKTLLKIKPDAVFVTWSTEDVLLTLEGDTVELQDFDIVWIHQGDSSESSGPLYGAPVRKALREYVQNENGLFLSGAAMSLVNNLGFEAAVLRRGSTGEDSGTGTVTPLIKGHPIFKGLSSDGRSITFTNIGHPAFADFHGTGGPANGMLLARSGSNENPIVEYKHGEGRVLGVGWRVSDYGHMSQSNHAAELERLTANVIDYLATPSDWHEFVVTPVPGGRTIERPAPGIPAEDIEALRLAVEDLSGTYPTEYAEGAAYLACLEAIASEQVLILPADGEPASEENLSSEALGRLIDLQDEFATLRQDALLANPLLDFGQLIYVRRGQGKLGLPMNYQSNSSLAKTGYDNQMNVLSPIQPDGNIETLYTPEEGAFVGDIEMNFDGERLLFSMPGSNGRWQIHEMNVDGTGISEFPLIHEPDVDNYDACYLPDDRIIFTSTAPFVGVPCVRGNSHVTNLYQFDPAVGDVRQLTVDQEHNWCPAVLNNGRVLYQRWEYSDTPHAFYRLLFHMNPDGTGQVEYYGSNSYWPNAMFYARPIPGHPTKVVTVVGGHHDDPRMGELVILDPAEGRFEADGAVQRIPGRDKEIAPILLDGLVKKSWPKFLHPYPLSEKYFLVSCRPNAGSTWGIYLVDVYDNIVKIIDEPGYALLEPTPILAVERPPVLPDRIDLDRDDATVLVTNIYNGPGLKDVAPGSVHSLRLMTYNFSYQGMGGQQDRVGFDGPWDVKTVIGTVPVEADGSAFFQVPAMTPIAIQPLDAEGKAIQLMRSWFTAQPGEVVSCTGCHELQNSTPMATPPRAAFRAPSEIKPWYGPTRGFSYRREVQQVLDRYCVSCHDGVARTDGLELCSLLDGPDVHPTAHKANYNEPAHFSPSYMELKQFIRNPTIESDAHLLTPRDFHADTNRLVQMLQKGHFGVQLDAESWDRLITWIDLNTPAHGTWVDICGNDRVDHQAERRREMRRLYAGIDEDPEYVYNPYDSEATSSLLSPEESERRILEYIEQRRRPAPEATVRPVSATSVEPVSTASLEIMITEDVAMTLQQITSGAFVMGDDYGESDARPARPVTIEQNFLMGRFEVTNQQFAAFDPAHDSRLEHGDFLQFSITERGYPLNGADQPVVRVSWKKADAYCRWLSEKTGRTFRLPMETEWEYACRAGSKTLLSYGTLNDDFSSFANISDQANQAVGTYGFALPSGAIPLWRPADVRFNDGNRVSASVGSYTANAFGLHDMHGNAAEWTASDYVAYDGTPVAHFGPNSNAELAPMTKKVVRGGSWNSRPWEAASSRRIAYPSDFQVFDVGFRVVCEE
jgi:formylglycine-generating enzyme required for sulfatase activity